MSDGRYSFFSDEKPTVRVPAPAPTEQELRDKIAATEQQISLLIGRRERLLQKLAAHLKGQGL